LSQRKLCKTDRHPRKAEYGGPFQKRIRMSIAPIGTGIIGQRCMLSDEGVAMLGRRSAHKLDRTGTIVALKGDNYVVRWDGNAEQTVKPYARRYVKIIPKAPPS
jgi:hypothetical protein